jgi:heme/copper-type cytochrome/quinol oxidase subunit 1
MFANPSNHRRRKDREWAMIASAGQEILAIAILIVPVVLIYLWQEHGKGGRLKSRFNRWVDAGGLLQYKKKPPSPKAEGHETFSSRNSP